MHSAVQLIELGGILLVLGLLGVVAVRASISPIPLYLLVGLAFGAGGILPLSTSETFVATGAEVGVILLLFTLGLEYTPQELAGTMRTSAKVGLADLVLNATPGVVAALLLGWGPIAAVVMGGVTYVTSSGITAKMLSDLGWLGNRETPAVLSVLVFEDLAMAVYLPILTTLLAGASLAAGATSLAIAAGTVTVILVIAFRFGGAVSRFVASPSDEVLLLKVLGLTVLVAGIAQQLHVSAAVGAFLVGIALSGPMAHTAAELLAPLRDLFAAVFFVFFGLQTDPADLPPVLGIAALLALIGLITKLGTGWLAASRAGVGVTGRMRAATSLMPRGEFSIVIASLAVAAGTNPSLGALAAAYVLILATVAPLLARAAEPATRAARRYAMRRRQSAEGQSAGEQPAADHPADDQRAENKAGKPRVEGTDEPEAVSG